MNKETLTEYKNYLQIIPDRGSEAYLHKIASELMLERKATTDLIRRMRDALKTARAYLNIRGTNIDIEEADAWLKENGDE